MRIHLHDHVVSKPHVQIPIGACGNSGPTTHDITLVTCKSCRRTRRFQRIKDIPALP